MPSENKQIHQRSISWAVGLYLVITLLLTSCNLPGHRASQFFVESSGESGVVIVDPIDGSQLQVGDFLDIHSKITDPSGVISAALLVNDQPYRQDRFYSQVPSGDLYQPWTPQEPGTYMLQVKLETNSGSQPVSNPITVVVGAQPGIKDEDTLTPTITLTVTWTMSPTSETPTLTPTPDEAMATGNQNLNCRKGPDPLYEVQGILMEGETVPIVGRNDNSSWYVVKLAQPPLECWVWGGGVIPTGNLEDVTVVIPPPLPATDTPKPEKPAYKACHDYPDMQTCNQDPAGFGNCNWDTGMNKCKP